MSCDQLRSRKHLKRIPVWIREDKSVVYYVTVCTAHRQEIFYKKNSVEILLKCLEKISKRMRWKVLNVCVMPDHVHLLISPLLNRDQDLSRFVQGWKSSVTIGLHEEGVTNKVWQKEFFDRLLRSSEKLSGAWNYIRNNPVRADLCLDPDDYLFSGTLESILRNCREGMPVGFPSI